MENLFENLKTELKKNENETSLKSPFSPENFEGNFKYEGSAIIISQKSDLSDISAGFHHHLNEINQVFSKFESKIEIYFMREK